MQTAAMEIRQIKTEELFSQAGFKRLCAEYALESGNPDLGCSNPCFEHYKKLEDMGVLSFVAAFEDEAMVGFAEVSVLNHPHYNRMIGSVGTLWLEKNARKGSAGLRLIRELMKVAKSKGAVGVYCSAPFGSRLERLYERLFKRTDSVFWVNFGGN